VIHAGALSNPSKLNVSWHVRSALVFGRHEAVNII
jgi:hypothetical protein